MKPLCYLTGMLVFSVLTLTGCGKDAENVIKNATNEPDLNGGYSSTCSGSELVDLSMQETFRFNADGTFSRYQDYFKSEDCSDKDVEGSVEISGKYSVDNNGAPDSEGGAILFELKKAYVQVNSELLAGGLNTIDFCGANDYAVGAKVEISGGSDGTLCPVQKVPETLYGVYREDKGKFYLNEGGLSSMGETKQKRPLGLDLEKVYRKQE